MIGKLVLFLENAFLGDVFVMKTRSLAIFLEDSVNHVHQTSIPIKLQIAQYSAHKTFHAILMAIVTKKGSAHASIQMKWVSSGVILVMNVKLAFMETSANFQ